MFENFFILAHRGISSKYPENTMLSFEKAFENNMDGIELDVQLSKDGEVVVIHDETLDRTTNGSGYVKDHTLLQLKNLDAGSFKDKRYSSCTIPTLDEVLEFFKGKNIIINIELKTSKFEYKDIEVKVLNSIKKHQMDSKVFITSFNHQSIERIREIDKDIKCGILLGDITFDIVKYVTQNNIHMINPSIEYFEMDTKAFLELKDIGKTITVYTVDDIQKIRWLKDLGINVITNLPIQL